MKDIEVKESTTKYYSCEFTLEQAMHAVQTVYGVSFPIDAMAVKEPNGELRYYCKGTDLIEIIWKEDGDEL